MWEFLNRNVFGATRSPSYGGFSLGLGLWALLVAPHATGLAGVKDLGWILLAFAVFNAYMLIISTQLNWAVFGVFLTLELTEIFLFIGFFTTKTGSGGLIKVVGIIGIITDAVARKTSTASVMTSPDRKLLLTSAICFFRPLTQ